MLKINIIYSYGIQKQDKEILTEKCIILPGSLTYSINVAFLTLLPCSDCQNKTNKDS